MLRHVKAHLAAGGIIAYATESCFGLGCDPFNAHAVRDLLRLKRRPQAKGLIVVATKLDQLKDFMARLEPSLMQRAEAKWPGPHTWLVPPSRKVPRWLKGRHDRIALRVTAHPGASALCRQLGRALVSTSANRASRVPIKTYRECVRQFGRSALVLPGRCGARKRPSVIEDLPSGHVLRS